jgi:putative effector of murein hydrolase LrgA (UPF0299 family)
LLLLLLLLLFYGILDGVVAAPDFFISLLLLLLHPRYIGLAACYCLLHMLLSPVMNIPSTAAIP